MVSVESSYAAGGGRETRGLANGDATHGRGRGSMDARHGGAGQTHRLAVVPTAPRVLSRTSRALTWLVRTLTWTVWEGEVERLALAPTARDTKDRDATGGADARSISGPRLPAARGPWTEAPAPTPRRTHAAIATASAARPRATEVANGRTIQTRIRSQYSPRVCAALGAAGTALLE